MTRFFIPFVLVAISAPACAPEGPKIRKEVIYDDLFEEYLIGHLKDGKRHGTWYRYHPDGNPAGIEFWRDGVQHGPYRQWDTDGTLFEDGRYVNGKLHGRLRRFYGPGRLYELGWIRKGHVDGTVCRWRPDGSLQIVKVWEYNRLRLVDNQPKGPCPTLEGEGRRHLDPKDLNYD